MKPKTWKEIEKLSKKPIKEILDNYEINSQSITTKNTSIQKRR